MEVASQPQMVGMLGLIEKTAAIVSAYVSNNAVSAHDMPQLLASVHAALVGLGRTHGPGEPPGNALTPAQIRRSIKRDALISFIDGQAYKTLKRHLAKNGLTPNGYRERYGLPRDYPMTAASYSAQRSELAQRQGLGKRATSRA